MSENFFNSEINDLRRERELLIDEEINGKNSFAGYIKDRLGNEIKAVLENKSIVEPQIKPKKKSKISLFLDKLAKIW